MPASSSGSSSADSSRQWISMYRMVPGAGGSSRSSGSASQAPGTGRTSTEPITETGCRAAIPTASSRLSHSSRS